MASSRLDIHNIPAIKLPENPANTHSQAKVLKNGSISVSKGGVIVDKANEIMKNALKNQCNPSGISLIHLPSCEY